jgi:hypothetical protein
MFPLGRWRVSAVTSLACLLLVFCAEVSLAQTFVSEGPGPRFGPSNLAQSGDAAPNGSEAGAIQAILPDPALGAGTIFAGSPNGGVWVTKNDGVTWRPLTDRQASLSIASLALDPTDPSGKTIIAGIGITSSSSLGGAQTGILYTTNGGSSWSALGTAIFAGQNVIGVEARGNTILAGTSGGLATNGLYRSIDGGSNFERISPANGLPAGAVTSLVADPSDPSRFYAAIKNSNNAATAVYVSNNMGATWAPVFTSANTCSSANTCLIAPTKDTTITLAAGPNGSVAVAIADLTGKKSALTGVFLSGNNGATWNQLTAAPNVIPGGQESNLHIAIDPTRKNVVYLTGDAYQTCSSEPPASLCTLKAFRINYNPRSKSSTATSLTTEGRIRISLMPTLLTLIHER